MGQMIGGDLKIGHTGNAVHPCAKSASFKQILGASSDSSQVQFKPWTLQID